MLFFFLLIVILMISDMQIAPLGEYQTGYMSKESNNCIKGIFILMILMGHYAQYCTLDGAADMAYWAVRLHVGQCVVAMFMFYSGYGLMESIRRKGYPYVRKIPIQRFLKVWWNFAVVVFCYLILDLILQIHYPALRIVLAFTGYTTIGASNWYMFAIFYLYLLTFLAFLVVRWRADTVGYVIGIALLIVLTVGAIYWQMKIGRDAYNYNTMLVYPLGMIFSLLRPQFEKLVTKDGLWYGLCFLLVMLIYMFTSIHRGDRFLIYTLWVFAFTGAGVLLTMKVSFRSWVLEWFGKNLFWVYILQRMPMIVLSHFGMIERHRYFCLVIVFITTICLTLLFDRTLGKWTDKLFDKLPGGRGSRTIEGRRVQ